MEIVSLILIIIIAFLPILIWGYIFSYLDNSSLNAQRFGIGILAGALSVVPVLFLSDIMSAINMSHLNIFPLLIEKNQTMHILLSLIVTIVMIAISIFIFSFGFFSKNIAKSIKILLKNTFILTLLWVGFALLHLLLFQIDIFNNTLSNGGVTLQNTAFNTLKLVFFYYVIIAIIEEVSKHFCVITSSVTAVDSIKKWVLFSIFIALGFGFIENILYIKNIAEQSWGWSSSVVTTWIFRSIFSLMTHIICSVLVGLYFSRALLLQYIDTPKLLSYIKTLLSGFILSILVHAIFDISLTIGFTGIIFIYFFAWYLGITKIFYEEDT